MTFIKSLNRNLPEGCAAADPHSVEGFVSAVRCGEGRSCQRHKMRGALFCRETLAASLSMQVCVYWCVCVYLCERESVSERAGESVNYIIPCVGSVGREGVRERVRER